MVYSTKQNIFTFPYSISVFFYAPNAATTYQSNQMVEEMHQFDQQLDLKENRRMYIGKAPVYLILSWDFKGQGHLDPGMTPLLQKIDNVLNLYHKKPPKFHLSKINEILVVTLWEFGSLGVFSQPSTVQVLCLLLRLLVQIFSLFFSFSSILIRHFLQSLLCKATFFY